MRMPSVSDVLSTPSSCTISFGQQQDQSYALFGRHHILAFAIQNIDCMVTCECNLNRTDFVDTEGSIPYDIVAYLDQTNCQKVIHFIAALS